MYVVKVAPITKGLFKGELSYFSKEDLPRGALALATIRGKSTPSIILESSPLDEQKTSVRKSAFALKKLGNLKERSYLSEVCIRAAEETALYHACSLPEALSTLLPNTYTGAGLPYPLLKERSFNTKVEEYVLQDSDTDRYAHYKRLVREAFARKRSLMFVVPTYADLIYAERELGRGIEDHVHILHGAQSAPAMKKAGLAIRETAQPILLLTTPIGFAFLRDDMDTIIVDRESSSAYKRSTRPFIDTRIAFRALAKKAHIKLIWGDILLRTETLDELENGNLLPLTPVKFRLISQAECHILNIRAEEKEALLRKEKGRAIGHALALAIEQSISTTGRVFLLAGRRGLSPTTVCSDCGETVRCSRCSTPFVLHHIDKRYVYACHSCGHSEVPPDDCPSCGSWKLTLLGIGIEKAEEELRKRFPQSKLIRIDSDSSTGKNSTEEKVAEFYQTPGSILLATEMAIPYLRDPIEMVGVISIDALLVLPDFRIRARIMNMLTRIRERATDSFLIQTRNPDEELFSFAVKGSLMEFFRTDREERKTYEYPPYYTLIKITRTGRRDVVLDDMAALSKEFKIYSPSIIASYEEVPRGITTMHALIRIPTQEWPQHDVRLLLQELPPEFVVDIDPLNIL